jgi:ribosomal protein S18 acetylase RimI-like enzyme
MKITMKLEIRRLSSADLSTLNRIAQDVFDAPINPDHMRRYLDTPGHIMMIAIIDGLVVGQCAAVIQHHPDKPKDMYIDELGVSPAYQRHGIARRLMSEMLDLGKALHCAQCWVTTHSDNAPARGLYQTLGARAESTVLYAFDL